MIFFYTRHNEVPTLREHDATVDANYYNHVLVALKRLGKQIRFRIPKLKHLDLILQKDAWVVVDRALYDYPIVAWTEFEVKGRDTMHEPIKCKIRYFHVNATMIKARTLDAMEMLLGEELADKITNNELEEATVIPFRNR